MKIEDPFSPPGDQSDLNKLRRTRRPLPALGRNLFCVCSCSQVCSSLGRGWGGGGGNTSFAVIWAHQVTPRHASFIGAAGWMSERWGPGWRAVSWRWGPAGHGGRAAGWPHCCPLAPIPRCFPPSGCSAAPDTRSGHSGTPHLLCCVFQRFG